MIKAIFVLALVAIQGSCFLSTIQSLSGVHQSHEQFQSWSNDFGKVYKSTLDYLYRLYVFHNNRLKIEAHNSNSANTFTLALNHFGDLTSEEFMARYTSKNLVPNPSLVATNKQEDEGRSAENERIKNLKLDNEVNWVERGMVNPVQDQGLCGSCYAFSSTAAIESAYAIANQGKLLKFSEQYVVNCGDQKGYKLYGCMGGVLTETGRFAKNVGVFTNDDYPYKEEKENCDSNAKPFTQIKDFNSITSEKMADLLAEVMQGPIALSIEVTPVYQFYQFGVMNVKAPCGFFINHGVTVVGYNLNADIPYLLIRNSYSESWGEKGYFRHSIGDLKTSGTCGFANSLSMRPIF